MKRCTSKSLCLTAPNTELSSQCFETLESGNLRGKCRKCNNRPRNTAKTCLRKAGCLTVEGGFLTLDGFYRNPKTKTYFLLCKKCHNFKASITGSWGFGSDAPNPVQNFMARRLWNADNAAVINAHCEQRSMAL